MLGGAGIVDQRVEPSPGGRGRGDLLAVLVARDVALHHHDFGAGAAAEIGGRFGFLLAVGIIDDDARAALGQNGRGRGPQAGRRTRYDRAQTILRHPHFLFLILMGRRSWPGAWLPYRAANACKSAKLHWAEFILCLMTFMPCRLQRALRTALVMAMAFPHHKAQEKTAPGPTDRWPARARPGRVPIKTGNAVAESENIVAETAEKIFADLADAQTINSDKNGAWKAPLWQALTEAGLPLSWVPEDCGGSGASLAEGFCVLSAAGRFAVAVPLAETMLAGWLLAQAKIASPEGEMTVAPASPKDRITLNADGTPVRPGPRRAVCQGRKTYRRARQRRQGRFRSRWSMPAACRIEAGLGLGGDASDTVTFDKVAADRDQAGAEGLRPDRADADGRRRAQPADRRRAGIDARHQRALFQRARRLRKEDLEIPGGAAQSGAARRRVGGGAGGGDLGGRRHRQQPPRSTTQCSSKRRRQRSAARKPPKRAAPSPIRCMARSASPSSTSCIATRLRALAWRDDFGSESYWAVELGKLVADRGADELWPLVASR